MDAFASTTSDAEKLLSKAKQIVKGATLEEAGIEGSWMSSYAEIARRCRDDREFGLSRYPYEQGPAVGAFTGGYFEHREWPVRKGLERHISMRPVYEYEANYMNAAGYWMSFHQSAMALRQEAIASKATEKAKKFDSWAYIAVRYGLRVIGLRVEFYKRAAVDPVHAKMVMPALEQKNDMAAADDLTEALERLDTHMTTQLMKAAATLSASNAMKRSGGGDAAGQQ